MRILRRFFSGLPILALLAAPVTVHAVDTWTEVLTPGFSLTSSSGTGQGLVFNDGTSDYIYFGASNDAYGALLIRSADGVTWAQANSPGFAASGSSNPAVSGAPWLAKFNSALFAGTASTGSSGLGARVFRSATGIGPWTQVFSSGVTTSVLDQNVSNTAEAFGAFLLFGTVNTSSGGTVWYSNTGTSEGSWTQATGATGGFGSGVANSSVTYLKTHSSNGFVYAATAGTSTAKGKIYRSSNLSTWNETIDAPTTFSANSRGVSVLEELGGYLYAGTINTVTGAQLWRSNTPNTAGSWAQVYSFEDGSNTGSKDTGRFSIASSSEIHVLNNISGTLYLGTSDGSGSRVYRSTDGVTWYLSTTTWSSSEHVGGFVGHAGNVYATTYDKNNLGHIIRTPFVDIVAPGAITTFSPLSPSTTYQIQYTWTSTGHDGSVGTLLTGSTYYIHYATYSAPLTFSTASAQIVFSTANVAVGSYQSRISTSLVANTSYYARIFVVDPSGNGSSLSNLTTMATLALPPTALAASYTNVHLTSVSAAWANFPTNDVSSMTSQGYQLEASSSNFSGGTTFTSATASVPYSTLTISGLSANATYYFRVGSRNWVDSLNYTALGSTITRPAPPGQLSYLYDSVTSSAVMASWTSTTSVNQSSLTFTADLSTDNFTTFNASSATLLSSATFGLNGFGPNLLPNTTYQVRVTARNTGWQSPYLIYGATATLANAPIASSATVFYSSITLSYTTAGNNTGTTYYAQASTDSFTTISVQATGLADSVTLTGLNANTTYQLRLKAHNHRQVPTAYATYNATATLLALPTSAAPTSVSSTSITVNWGGNGNSSSTLFFVQGSSDGFVTLITSSTRNSVFISTGLLPNTSYTFMVKAFGIYGDVTPFVTLPSTTTTLVAPSTATPYFSTIDVSSITVQWTAGGNSTSALYLAQISVSSTFATVLTSSVTRNFSVLFGAGGEGASLGLNTTYYFQVKSSEGVTASLFLSLGSTATLAAAPASSTWVYVSSVAVLWDWQPNGNLENATTYQAQISLDSSFTSPTTVLVTTSTYLSTGLTAKTSYFFRVRAINHAGAPTPYTTVLSTYTLPYPPGTAGAPSGYAMGSSSIIWNWTLATDATSYNIFQSTINTQLIGVSSASTFAYTNLPPNTSYQIQVNGVGPTGSGSLSSASNVVYTLANIPTSLSTPTINATSVTLTWSLNSNPAGTTASVERSTDASNFVAVFTGTVTTNTELGLLGCTNYFYRVRNTNSDGFKTVYSSTLMFTTMGSTPTTAAGLTASALTGNKISLSWGFSSFEGVTQYKLYYDAGSGVINTGSPLAVFTSTESSYTTGVLTSSAAYTFLLRATNRCGVEEKNTSVLAAAASIATLPSLQAKITSPTSGQKVAGNRVTLNSELASGSYSSVGSILFQYKASTSTTWQNLASSVSGEANPDTTYPYYIHWDASAISTTTYDLRAVVYDTSGSSDTVPASISVTVSTGDVDVLETQVSGVLTKTQIINNTVTNTVATADDTSGLITKLTIPAGALTNTTVTVTMVNNPTTLPSASPPGATSLGVGISITLSDGQSNLAGGNLASITLSYKDSNDDQIVDGTTLGAKQLQFYSYDGTKWVKDVTTTVDTTNRTITGLTSHFSFFAVFGVAASDLFNVRVYPNPYKPNGGVADEGKPFTNGDATSGILFDNLPETVIIKIYTLSGQPVAQFSQDRGPGRLRWDARNDSGFDVASGLYLAIIQSPGKQTIVRKILIIR